MTASIGLPPAARAASTMVPDHHRHRHQQQPAERPPPRCALEQAQFVVTQHHAGDEQPAEVLVRRLARRLRLEEHHQARDGHDEEHCTGQRVAKD